MAKAGETIIAAVPDDREHLALERTWRSPAGFWGWLSDAHHQSIGKRFVVTAFSFFLLGGILALKADFSDAILKDAKLVRANLKQANMKGANLSGADLSGCDLGGADLQDAVLVGVKTVGWNVSDANLKGVLTDEVKRRCSDIAGRFAGEEPLEAAADALEELAAKGTAGAGGTRRAAHAR